MFDVLSSSGTPPWVLIWQIIANGGWVVLVIFVFLGLRVGWLNWRQNVWYAKQKFIMLAVDIPREQEQTPKAVEQIFNALWALKSGGNKKDKWIDGKVQLPYSIEIVSLEGFIQFLIYLPEPFRDLVESAIFAQYPDSTIVEVEDYTTGIPKTFPDEEWDLWGTEMQLVKPSAYPIKTYMHFEHSLSQQFIDPLSGLLEIMSKLGPGEQIWVQWVITPLGDDWKSVSEKEVKKLIGLKVPPKKSFIGKMFGTVFEQIRDILYQGMGSSAGISASSGAEKSEPTSKLNELTPGEKVVVEAVQMKAAKVGYETKMRVVYASKKDVMNKARGVAGLIGGFRQFSSLDTNGFKPHGKVTTGADYIRVDQRVAKKQNRLLYGYRSRNQKSGGGKGFVLNVEELASLWHFPSELVRAPRLKRSSNKMVEPPAELPTDRPLQEVDTSTPQVSLESTVSAEDALPQPPSSDTGGGIQVVLEKPDAHQEPAFKPSDESVSEQTPHLEPIPESTSESTAESMPVTRPEPRPSVEANVQAPSSSGSGGAPPNLPM